MAKNNKKKDKDILYVRKGATLKEIYAQIRREFTAADLQKYTEIDTEPTVPAAQLLAELKAIHREETLKLKDKPKGNKKKKK